MRRITYPSTAVIILILTGLIACGAGRGPASPLSERLARSEASIHALDRRLSDVASRGGKGANAAVVERVRRLGRRRAKSALAWREYVRNVPGAVDVSGYSSEAAQRDADKAAAEVGDDLDALWARRKQIEAERMVLWAKIAFRSIKDRELPDQPLYRFELKAAVGKTPSEQRMEALRAAAQFVRAVDHMSGQAEDAVDADPSAVFGQWCKLLGDERTALQDKLLTKSELALDVYKPGTEAGRLSAAAKTLAELARTIVDADKALSAAENAQDDDAADASRAQLQKALADTARAVTRLDTAVGHTAAAWGIGFTPGTKAAVGPFANISLEGLAPHQETGKGLQSLAEIQKAFIDFREQCGDFIQGLNGLQGHREFGSLVKKGESDLANGLSTEAAKQAFVEDLNQIRSKLKALERGRVQADASKNRSRELGLIVTALQQKVDAYQPPPETAATAPPPAVGVTAPPLSSAEVVARKYDAGYGPFLFGSSPAEAALALGKTMKTDWASLKVAHEYPDHEVRYICVRMDRLPQLQRSDGQKVSDASP